MAPVDDTRPLPSPEDLVQRLATLPLEDLRLALVLNGGVSLAVWMGGVAHEIDRLTRATSEDGLTYGPLLRAARTDVSVDIIAGTSAGGINGAALALAQANRRADLSALRNLWSEQGDMEQLLRRPFQGSPTSILRGDDYFLPELRRAMRMLAVPFEPRAAYTPLDVTLTTTLLRGAEEVVIDDFGERIPQRLHAGSLRFSNVDQRRPSRDATGQPTGGSSDLFGADRIETTADAMAVASRCTASFPVAFEPSFVPVGESVVDPRRADMGPFASWAREEDPVPETTDEHAVGNRTDGSGLDRIRSRYAVDGGLLANTPVDHALDAIERRQAEGPVRRALLLVFPHAPESERMAPDRASDPPTAAGAVGGVLGALLAQGSRSFVERVESHNRRAADWRGSRDQILEGFGGGRPVADLYDLLSKGWPHYRHVRFRAAARGLADKVIRKRQWSYERIRDAAERAQRGWATAGGRECPLPYVPAGFWWDDPSWHAVFLGAGRGWAWGDSAALGVLESVTAVLRSALAVAPDWLRDPLAEARLRVGEQTLAVRAERDDLDRIWETDRYLRGLTPDTSYWTARIIGYERSMLPAARKSHLGLLERALRDRQDGRVTRPPDAVCEHFAQRDGAQGRAIDAAVRVALEPLLQHREELIRLAERAEGADEVSGLRRWTRFLYAQRVSGEPGASGPVDPSAAEPGADSGAGEPTDEAARLLLRLLALDAGTRLVSDPPTTGANLPIDFAELSLRISHPWARFSISPDDKAAGLELGRFGGFLKRSWRMNDWTWGRLDAVTMLCQAVLDPRRMRRLATMAATWQPREEWKPDQPGQPDQPDQRVPGARTPPASVTDVASAIFEDLRAGMYGDRHIPPDLDHLARAARAELIDALEPGSEVRHMPTLARWAALPLQAEIMLEELPWVAAAVANDVAAGAGTPTRGTRFLTDRKDLLQRIAAGPADRLAVGCEALTAFDAAGIGREPLSEETGSNALIRMAANAAGVAATVLDTGASRSPTARKVTGALRGAVMLPYWIVAGLASGGPIVRFLASIGIMAGGLLLVLSLLGVLGALDAAAGVVGAAALLAALAYSALKTGTLLHAVALLAPVGPLCAYALGQREAEGSGEAAVRLLVILAVFVGLYVLASLPWPLLSPLAVVHHLPERARASWKRLRPRTQKFLVAGAVVAVLVALVLLWKREAMAAAFGAVVAALDERLPLQVLATILLVVVGAMVSYREGVMLRTWRVEQPRRTDAAAAAGESADAAGAGDQDGDGMPSYEEPGHVRGCFGLPDLHHPAGVAATWAPVYGGGVLVLAMLIRAWLGTDREGWQQFTLWWLATLGVLLCLAAPLLVARGSRGRVPDLLRAPWAEQPRPTRDDGRSLPRAGDDSQRLLHQLLKYDLPFRFLVEPAPRASARERLRGRPREATELRLTPAGRRLLSALNRGHGGGG